MPSKEYCEDCGKEIITPEDSVSAFNCNRCASCEALMFEYMNKINNESK